MKRIAVFCGSATGKDPLYREKAQELAGFLVSRGITLINGGGRIGIMGIMADEMLRLGGECIGVIPMGLKERELAHPKMTELITTPDMHGRKRVMTELADGFIAFPGGFGTLDELFESITWRQLGIHEKPVGLLNVNGYFDALIALVDRMQQEGFMNPASRQILLASPDIESLLEKMEYASAETIDKWRSS